MINYAYNGIYLHSCYLTLMAVCRNLPLINYYFLNILTTYISNRLNTYFYSKRIVLYYPQVVEI